MSPKTNGNTFIQEDGGVSLLPWTVLIAAVLATVPVKLDIQVNAASSVSYQCEITLYAFKLRFGGPVNKRFLLSLRKAEASSSLSQLFTFVKSVYTRAISRRVAFFCLIGTGDACRTAIVAGGVESLLCLIFARAKAKIRVAPDFRRAVFQARGRCILCFRGGDIIVAGMRAFHGRLSGAEK